MGLRTSNFPCLPDRQVAGMLKIYSINNMIFNTQNLTQIISNSIYLRVVAISVDFTGLLLNIHGFTFLKIDFENY